MLKVKTRIGLSAIEGIGLFADEFIKKGTVIWTYDPMFDRTYTEDDVDSMTDIEWSYVKKYSFKYAGEYCLCCDDARFFNHSESPNSTEVVNDIPFGCTIAARDIYPHEELTTDYATFGQTEEDNLFNKDF